MSQYRAQVRSYLPFFMTMVMLVKSGHARTCCSVGAAVIMAARDCRTP